MTHGPRLYVSNRLVPERDHREIMHRARAFRIFEVSVALSKNKRSVDTATEALDAIEKVAFELQFRLEKESGEGVVSNSEEPKDKNDPGVTRRRLLAARDVVKNRIAAAEAEFGEDQVNRADLEELRVIEDQLFNMACEGVTLVQPPPPPPSALRPRLAVAKQEAKNLKTRLKRLEEERVFLSRVFDKAYETEEADPDVDESSDSEDGEAEDEFGAILETGTPPLPPTGTRSYELGNSTPPTKPRRKRKLRVPSVSVEEASRFFLLAHILSHLESAESYDVHGKTFYDLTGSGGQVCAAAQFCLPDGGKLNSELGEWAAAAGLVGAVGAPPDSFGLDSSGGGGGGAGGVRPAASMSRFERFKQEQEERRRKAEEEAVAAAEAEAQAQELADAEAEAAAAKAGKVSAADLEAKAPRWPFGQVYSTEADGNENGASSGGSGRGGGGCGQKPSSPSLGSATTLGTTTTTERRRRPSALSSSSPVRGTAGATATATATVVWKPGAGLRGASLAEEARRAHESVAKREAAKRARAEELLIRGRGFEYRKTPDPCWERMVSFEATRSGFEDAQALIEVGFPKRRTQAAVDAAARAAQAQAGVTQGGGCRFGGPEDKSLAWTPSTSSSSSSRVASPAASSRPDTVGGGGEFCFSSRASSAATPTTPGVGAGWGSGGAPPTPPPRRLGSPMSSGARSARSGGGGGRGSSTRPTSPFSANSTDGSTATGKSSAQSARSRRRRKTIVDVRETDFMDAGTDWEDGDVVFFDTSFGLGSGVDEGALITTLESYLVRLQPGSYAILVTRCLKRIVDPENPQLQLVTMTRRLLRPGEEVAAWLVKVTQPRR